MAVKNAAQQRHADWIGMAQPEGLVVSVPVLDDLEVYVKQPREATLELREAAPEGEIADLQTLAGLLGWTDRELVPAPADLLLDLPDLNTTVRPSHVLNDRRGELVAVVHWVDGELDDPVKGEAWTASATERLERLLTHLGHPVGVLVSPGQVRLTFAPLGEAPGRLTFTFAELITPDGALLVDALHMLLGRRAPELPDRTSDLKVGADSTLLSELLDICRHVNLLTDA